MTKRCMTLHILFVAEYYFANPDFVRLSTELARRKHRVSVATSLRVVDKHRSEENVDIFEINPLITIYSIPHSLSFPFSGMYKLVQEQNVEVIHALMDYSTNTALAALVSKLTDVPFVYTVQGMGTRKNRLVVDTLAECYDRTIERLVAGTARKVILLSRSLVSRARKVGVEDSANVVIPSGVDYDRFNSERPQVKTKATNLRNGLGINDNDVVIGFVGRLVPAKGLSYLFSAIKQIEPEHPNMVLLIVGDGPYRSNLETMAKSLKTKTIFAGWQADTAPFYAAMDIFALPSLFEGLPCVMLEAMALKTPVVATNVGGNADLVMNGENGFLVPTRNPEKIAFALKKLIVDDDLRAQMGAVNRKIIEKSFGWEKIVQKVETVYNEIV